MHTYPSDWKSAIIIIIPIIIIKEFRVPLYTGGCRAGHAGAVTVQKLPQWLLHAAPAAAQPPSDPPGPINRRLSGSGLRLCKATDTAVLPCIM
jgi:hypothetical protein